MNRRRNHPMNHHRTNRHLTIEPGVTRIRISLDEIMRGPAERDLDLTRIDRIVIFPIDPTGGVGVWLAPPELRQIEFVRR